MHVTEQTAFRDIGTRATHAVLRSVRRAAGIVAAILACENVLPFLGFLIPPQNPGERRARSLDLDGTDIRQVGKALRKPNLDPFPFIDDDAYHALRGPVRTACLVEAGDQPSEPFPDIPARFITGTAQSSP